jgi:hypothetical protein
VILLEKERYIKPEVKIETLEGEVLYQNYGSPAGGGNNTGGGGGGWFCP